MQIIPPSGQARTMGDGDWYWVNKEIIRRYTPSVRAVGIAVYNLLASLADRSQSCFPSQRYIAERLGYSRATVNQAIGLLRECRLVAVERIGGNRCRYRLLRVASNAGEKGLSNQPNRDVKSADANDIKLLKNTTDTDRRQPPRTSPAGLATDEDRVKLLAEDLARALGDLPGLRLYALYARRYPESFLRRTLSEVLEVAPDKIRKSRGALFNHLVKKYGKPNSNGPGP